MSADKVGQGPGEYNLHEQVLEFGVCGAVMCVQCDLILSLLLAHSSAFSLSRVH
jgi:hypothetical protein